MDEQEIQKQLVAIFQDEAQERIEALFSGLSSLENADEDALPDSILESVFREAHSLKGAARSVNLPVIESLCQEMESIFAAIKSNALTFSAELFDSLYAATRLIEESLSPDADAAETSEKINIMVQSLREITRRGQSSEQVSADAPEKPPEKRSDARYSATETHENRPQDPKSPKNRPDTEKQVSKPLFTSTVRIPAAKLDALLLKTEELITIKQSTHQRMNRVRQLSQAVQEWKQQWERFQQGLNQHAGIASPEAAIEQINQFIRHSNEFIQDFDLRIHQTHKALEHDHRIFSGLINDLLEETKNTSLMPFSGLFTVFPRMVREIAKDRGKLVDFKVAGESVEIDKRILEGIKDPLIHLVRNAIDHGIEAPEIRTTAGKPAVGTIHLTVSQPESNQVLLTITDDGNGIDVEAIKADAVKKGIISDADGVSMAHEAALKLAFHSGVSSSRMITEISGRGLGMSIVQDALDHLGGRMTIASEPHKGTVFTIRLPVTLATFRGILIEISGYLFVLPNSQVRHTLNIRPETIRTVENRPIISFNERPTSLVSLGDVLGLPKPESENLHSPKKSIPAVILENGTSQVAFYVDKVILEQEVLVKPLGKQLKKVRHFAGATILGTGQVVLILNPKDLIKTAAGQSIPAVQPAGPATVTADQPKSILIVEDSFTSRTLLKNILEASGYDIKTAIDGKDAWAQLQSRQFDVVVSDIEMPRMNGFDLTARIRADKSLAELPVILVTSLDSPADRERGVEIGADAYIVKSSFDQSNLLEVLNRFL